MIKTIWAWLVVADEQITCSSALLSISFTLNILLSAIPSARKNFFRIVRSRVHDSVINTVNASTLANIDDNSRILLIVGKIYKWLIVPFYDKKPIRVKWDEVVVTVIMVCLATASVVLIAFDNRSRLGLLFCIPFPLYFLLHTVMLLIRFWAIKLLAYVICKCCAKKEEPRKVKASEIFADIANIAGVSNSVSRGVPAASVGAPGASGTK